MPASAPLIPLRLDTPSRLETSQDFSGTGGRADAGFLAGVQKPASTRLIRPYGFKRRISAFSRDVFPAAANAAFVRPQKGREGRVVIRKKKTSCLKTGLLSWFPIVPHGFLQLVYAYFSYKCANRIDLSKAQF